MSQLEFLLLTQSGLFDIVQKSRIPQHPRNAYAARVLALFAPKAPLSKRDASEGLLNSRNQMHQDRSEGGGNAPGAVVRLTSAEWPEPTQLSTSCP